MGLLEYKIRDILLRISRLPPRSYLEAGSWSLTEIQGGVGTAGSANIGKRYAMFEAIHGSAPRMVDEGRAKYADPCSMIKAVAMMLDHIGEARKARKLDKIGRAHV